MNIHFIKRVKNRFEKIEKQNKRSKEEINELRIKYEDMTERYNELRLEITNRFYELLTDDKYEEEIKKRFFRGNGFTPDLENPKTLNEKIQWLKINNNIPEKATLTDKLAVREWVRDKIGSEYLTKVYGDWGTFDEINMEALPKKFVLKPNHASGMIIIVDDKSKLNIDLAREKVNKWLTTNYAYHGLEMQYKDIVPRIMAEEHLGISGQDFYDCKFWCFNGRVEFIKSLIMVNGKAFEACCYDREWRKTPFQAEGQKVKPDFEKPERLEDMIRLAEELSEGFKLVRVDMYQKGKDEIKFGEMTFTPDNGERRWVPQEYDRILGDLLILE